MLLNYTMLGIAGYLKHVIKTRKKFDIAYFEAVSRHLRETTEILSKDT
jgi:hypothetical protein